MHDPHLSSPHLPDSVDFAAAQERIRIMDELTRWEGQDPALQPPGASSGPSSEEGSGASGWVDVR